MRPLLSWCVAVLLVCASCIIEAPGGGGAQVERSRASVQQVPATAVPVRANFGGKVEIIGASVDPGRLTPGGRGRVTMYLKVNAPLEEDYTIFVHAEPQGRSDRMIFDHSPTGGYATSRWKVGETLKDEFVVTVPSNAAYESLALWVGFWEPKSDARLPLLNPESVKNDGNNRILLATVPVSR